MREARDPFGVSSVHWEELEAMDPQETTERSLCPWDPLSGYMVPFLLETYCVHPKNRSVLGKDGSPPNQPHLPLVLVHYLINARDLPLEGTWVTERQIPGGDLFFQRTHTLPTDRLVSGLGHCPEALIEAAKIHGGMRVQESPFSVQLRPLPRIPLRIHLWPGDEEFSPRCLFTFDASVPRHLPLDILWALTHAVADCILRTASDPPAPSPGSGPDASKVTAMPLP